MNNPLESMSYAELREVHEKGKLPNQETCNQIVRAAALEEMHRREGGRGI